MEYKLKFRPAAAKDLYKFFFLINTALSASLRLSATLSLARRAGLAGGRALSSFIKNLLYCSGSSIILELTTLPARHRYAQALAGGSDLFMASSKKFILTLVLLLPQDSKLAVASCLYLASIISFW